MDFLDSRCFATKGTKGERSITGGGLGGGGLEGMAGEKDEEGGWDRRQEGKVMAWIVKDE